MKWPSKRPIVRVLALASLIALVSCISGCIESSTPKGPATASINVGSAHYALYFSASSIDLDGTSNQGKVVLVGDDGGTTSFATRGMDHSSLAWSSDALYFSDMTTDFSLSDAGLQRVTSDKTDSQYGMFDLGAAGAVGVYNEGFNDAGGYDSQVVTVTGGKSTVNRVEGSFYVLAQCGGVIYGVGRASGPYAPGGEPESEPSVLHQLTGTADGRESNRGTSTVARADSTYVMNAPCVDGKIRYIADAGTGALGEVPRPVLATWDVESGAYSEVPVVAESFEAPLLRDDGTGTAQVGPASLRDGKLEWFGAENRVMSTDVSTGRTIQKFTVEGHTNNKASSQAVFTDAEVVVLVDNNDGSQYRIVRYDRDTGAERGRVTIAEPADSVSEGLLLRGFAIRP